MIQNSTDGATISRSSLHANTGRIAAVATALFLVLFLVLSVSRAAFTASTSNDGNFVTTDANGNVTLTDNDAGAALFTLENAEPGVDTVECINVRYAGDFSSGDIKMYAQVTDQVAPNVELAGFLDVTVNRIAVPEAAFDAPNCIAFDVANVAGGAENIYTGTLGDFPDDYATAPAGTTGEESVFGYQITISVQDDPNAAGARADWNFVWETQTA